MTEFMPISILYLIHFLHYYSGTEKHLIELVKNIDRARFKPFVVVFSGSETLKNELEAAGVPVEIINLRKIYGLQALGMLVRLRRFIRANNIRILQTFHPNPDIFGAVLAKFSGVPIVISSRRDMGINRSWRSVMLYKLLRPWVDRTICVSEAVKQLVMQSEHADPDKMTVIHNGILPETLAGTADRLRLRQSLGLAADKPVVGVLANFNTVKGHIYFIEAAALMLREQPGIQFVIVGHGEGNTIEATLRNRVGELGIGQSVHFLGYHRDIPEMLALMDVLVSPSLSEGFSNTLVEALFMRKPVVATSVGGNPEIIYNGETGLLVPPANPRALADAALSLLRDPVKAEAMAVRGRDLVEKCFLLPHMIDKTMRVYDELLAAKRVAL